MRSEPSEIIRIAQEWLARGERLCMATVVKKEGSGPREVGAKMLISSAGKTEGSIGGGAVEKEIMERAKQVMRTGKPVLVDFDLSGKVPDLDAMCGGGMSVFLEPWGEVKNLLVIGAGHVGLAVAGLAAEVGFQVTLVDDREEYLRPERLGRARGVLAGPEDWSGRLSLDQSSFVVVCTRGHSLDKEWLEVLIPVEPRYLGLLGSKEKARRIFLELQSKGIAAELLKKVHTPVGLDIGAVTPSEIAVSIVAELIRQWRKSEEKRPGVPSKNASSAPGGGGPIFAGSRRAPTVRSAGGPPSEPPAPQGAPSEAGALPGRFQQETSQGSDSFGKSLPRVLVVGGGELGSAVAHRLTRAGLTVFVIDIEKPKCIRRAVCFAAALAEGAKVVEGVRAVPVASCHQAREVAARESLPVLAGDFRQVAEELRPDVLVDARMLKTGSDVAAGIAPLVVGLGPGLVAGQDVDVVIETNRGHHLGRVIYEGSAEPATGVPAEVKGFAHQRVIRAPQAGVFHAGAEIGVMVEKGASLGTIDGKTTVPAPIDGLLRGLIANGARVRRGQKIGDVDPRGPAIDPYTISDKGRAVAGGVLEAIMYWWKGGHAGH
jgi:xanthine dehydrogenase accessory factor